MYAQVVEGRTTPQARHQLERLIRERVLPALRQQEGFAGVLHLVGCASDDTMTIVAWETEQQASRPLRDKGSPDPDVMTELATMAGRSQTRVSVWEVDARA